MLCLFREPESGTALPIVCTTAGNHTSTYGGGGQIHSLSFSHHRTPTNVRYFALRSELQWLHMKRATVLGNSGIMPLRQPTLAESAQPATIARASGSQRFDK